MKYLFFISIFLISCGHNIKNDFDSYVKLFERVNKTKIDSLDIHFGNTMYENELMAGLCYWSNENNNIEVVINKDVWLNLSASQKEALVLHEIAHGYYKDRVHRNGFFKAIAHFHYEEINIKCPESIMFYRVFNNEEIEVCYKNNRLYYLKELKSYRR